MNVSSPDWMPKAKLNGPQNRAINSIWNMFPVGEVPRTRLKMLAAIKRMGIKPRFRYGYGAKSHKIILKMLNSPK